MAIVGFIQGDPGGFALPMGLHGDFYGNLMKTMEIAIGNSPWEFLLRERTGI